MSLLYKQSSTATATQIEVLSYYFATGIETSLILRKTNNLLGKFKMKIRSTI